MECKNCKTVFEAEQLFENCTVSWPNKSWVYFVCPECQTKQHFEVHNGLVKSGFLDGAPGPCFITEKIHNLNRLSVSCDLEKGVTVQIDNYTKLIKKK